MNKKLFTGLITGSILVGMVGMANAVLIGGVEFPDGALSFADSVYSYTPGLNVGSGWNDPNAALGVPDYSGPNNSQAVSLGVDGSLILQFTDNSLTTSGDDSDDLYIFEIGGAIEWMNVAISTDAVSWIDLGDIMGQPSGIDIDDNSEVVAGEQYSYVRINDILPNQSGDPYGEADIDAVGAISSAPPVNSVPEPTTMLLFGTGLVGLVGLRRKKK